MSEPQAEPPRVVLTDPVPLRKADSRCPNPACRAEKDQRVPSCGFGVPHDVCGRCGHEFLEGV